VPDILNIAELERAFEQALQYSAIGQHRMPLPPWRTRPFDFDGPSTWQRLQAHLSQRPDPRPLSLYVHFPFCDRHCGFCDCLSRPLPRSRPSVVETFARRLASEIQLWAGLTGLHNRPLSTIHFGGGTPNCLPAPLFEEIVDQLKAAFQAGPETEWALESTTSLLEDAHLEWLSSLGFRRLHVGVQTLDDPIRKAIGRKEDSDNVKLRLESAVKRGFIVSADLIYGLPGQTLGTWIPGIHALLGIPVHGVSLYQLNISERNGRFLRRIGLDSPNHLLNYLFFQIAEQILLDAGYEKRFFNHFSRSADRNLYSLHASRGEDLVALGPTGDGVLSDLIYRHHDLDSYLLAEVPAFEGGMIRSEPERLINPLSVALMSGSVRPGALGSIPFSEPRLDAWSRQGLLAATPTGEGYRLTANGSWFICQMIDEVRGTIQRAGAR
jgi:coproporphyrinogen III oxidase-like Fe-S oxidoreductase